MTVLFDLHSFIKKEKYLLWVIEVKKNTSEASKVL